MIDLGDVVQKPARFRYTFIRAEIDSIFKNVKAQTKAVTIMAMAWQDHEAQARARLPWSWCQAPVIDMEVLRI